MSEYKKIPKEELTKIIEDLYYKEERKFIIYTVDKEDGQFKNLEETEQFRKALKERFEKVYGPGEDDYGRRKRI